MSRNIRMGIPALTRCHISVRGIKPPSRIETVRPYPFHPVSIGDYLRKKRLDLGLLRKHVAHRLNTSIDCVRNWENNWHGPDLQSLPKIIEFLGYCPYEPSLPMFQRLVIWRSYNGLSQETMAKLIDIDPSTLSRLERGKTISPKKQKASILIIKQRLCEL